MVTLIGWSPRSVRWSLATTDQCRPATTSQRARTIVLMALASGVLFGAFACAAAMGAGSGHGAHDRRPAHSVGDAHIEAAAPSSYRHGEHGAFTAIERTPTQSAAISWSTVDASDDSRSGETGQNHPGTACVVPVDLTFPDVAALGETATCAGPPIDRHSGWVGTPEPPVPRFS